MRTTLNLDDELMRKAKRAAADRGISLTALIEAALRDELTRVRRPTYRLDWQTERGKTRPPIEPADRDALYDLLERDD